ncbi:MAG TPA: amino acid ABC transporter permease [Actinomycetota bacterium]|nr:amino acid ABC transporter permease [Actinomycetota bacterium]
MRVNQGTGAGVARPRDLAQEGGRPGLRERLELASLAVPFRVKLAAVWLGIFVVLGALFALAGFDTAWMREEWLFVLKGLPWTVIISVASIALAIVLALFGALARLSRNPVAYGVSGFYVSFFRGTPLIVQLFLIYLGLPQVGANLERYVPGIHEALLFDPLTAGILGLGLNYGAYMTEIFRAGIQSIGHGQMEAAYALGMTYRQAMRRVILPQAVRVIIPPTGNEFIAMLKDSALVSLLGTVVSQMEIFRRAQLVGRADFRPFEAFVLAAAVYWGLTTIFQFFQGRLERRLSKGYVREYGAERRPRFVPAAAGASGGSSGGAQVGVPAPGAEVDPGG